MLTDFARLLTTEYQVGDALRDLVDGVTAVLGVSGAGVSLADADRLRFACAADEDVAALERFQEEHQMGPGLDAYLCGEPVLVADLEMMGRKWPLTRDAAAEAGFAAVAAIPMHLGASRLGVLDLYDRSPRDWSAEDVGVAGLLAGVATAHVANAGRLERARQTTEQLQHALDSRIVIEQAKGMLAGEGHISLDEAFRRLRTHARRHHTSLQTVADAVVNLGLRPDI